MILANHATRFDIVSPAQFYTKLRLRDAHLLFAHSRKYAVGSAKYLSIWPLKYFSYMRSHRRCMSLSPRCLYQPINCDAIASALSCSWILGKVLSFGSPNP